MNLATSSFSLYPLCFFVVVFVVFVFVFIFHIKCHRFFIPRTDVKFNNGEGISISMIRFTRTGFHCSKINQTLY